MTVSRLFFRRRRGVTLIELLVVVSIMMLLALIAVPMMRPAMEGRKMRETARAINVFISSVRNRAIQTGRPCGVLIRRMHLTDSGSTVQYTQHSQSGVMLQQVEIPPPDTGHYVGVYVCAQDWTRHPNGLYYWSRAPDGTPYPQGTIGPTVLKLRVPVGGLTSAPIRYGDMIQLHGQGPYYTIQEDPFDHMVCGADLDFVVDSNGVIDFSSGVDNNGDGWIDKRFLTAIFPPQRGIANPWPKVDPASPNLNLWSVPQPFTIFRQPAMDAHASFTRSAVRPLQMPEGLVIDLKFSGGNNDADDPEQYPGHVLPDWGDWFAAQDRDLSTPEIEDTSPVILMFGPSGNVQGIICSQLGNQPVTRPVHLLLGKADRMVLTWDTTTNKHRSAADDSEPNWRDISNLWITVNPQSGLVNVAPVAGGQTLAESRRYAIRAQANVGGR